MPPGTNPKTGKPNSVRLYSIASTRYGDDLAGDSVSLCVRRALYWDSELKAHDPAKKGVCSNFLCDSKPGDAVSVTGPTGKVMLMPEETPQADLIMIATGTGIAPYRGFLRRLFVEDTPAGQAFTGLSWLFLGVANADSLLYDDDWQEVRPSTRTACTNHREGARIRRSRSDAHAALLALDQRASPTTPPRPPVPAHLAPPDTVR
jgi:ferredoxin--NADP+ reductase